jgi:hypothetical protein
MSSLRFERTQLVMKPPKRTGVICTSPVIGEAAVAMGVLVTSAKETSNRLVLRNGRMLIFQPATKQRFMIVDEETGDVECERVYKPLARMWNERSGVILDDMVVFVSESGHVAAFDIYNGDLLFLESYNVAFSFLTALDADRLVATANDGHLWIFRRETGSS